MYSPTTFKWYSLMLLIFVLAACTAVVKPEWVRLYNHNADTQPDRLSWLQDMAVDNQGNILITGSGIRAGLQNREHNLLFVKYASNGERLWAREFNLATGDYRSDDDPRALVLDTAGNLYALAVQYRVIDDQSYYGSYLISLDANGNERWRQQLSDEQDMRGLALRDGRLYVAGKTTQVYNLNGEPQWQTEHSDHSAWSVAVSASGEFVLGGGKAVSYFSAAGERRWTREQPEGTLALGQAILAMDGSVIAAEAINPNGAARITRFSPQGQKLWSQTFPAARQSYGLPGPALIFEDNRGDIFLVTSNSAGRRVVKMDASGRVYWNKASGIGIVQDAALKNGDLYLVGGGKNQKYTSAGELIAESETGRAVQETLGRVVINGDLVYVGYSALENATFALHLSQFKDR